MKTTIDSAGRLVIPMEIRRQVGIKPGMALDIRAAEGRIEIAPSPLKIKLQRRSRLVVAVPQEPVQPLNAGTVEGTHRKLRRERAD